MQSDETLPRTVYDTELGNYHRNTYVYGIFDPK